MAKGIGLIGNFRGKVGNMVGYNLKDSNNKQTQGVRVYQPIVKNPKTFAQAEQRAKLAPINATYRMLKMIIDRGQEGKAYGNKSRLAWLSAAMKAFNGGWFEKGAAITAPAIVPLTKGSISFVPADFQAGGATMLKISSAVGQTNLNIGSLSTYILTDYPSLKNGDQLTFVEVGTLNNELVVNIASFVIDTTSTDSLPATLRWDDPTIDMVRSTDDSIAGCIVASREGDNGSHLRSTTALTNFAAYPSDILTDAAKETAIKSYMTGGSNVDWAEESLQG